jgi:DNA-binding NarL/FixJ family response regulator
MPSSNLVVVADRHLLDSELLAGQLSSVALSESARPGDLAALDLERVDLVLLDAEADDGVLGDVRRRAPALGLLYDRDSALLRDRAVYDRVRLVLSRSASLATLRDGVRTALEGSRRVRLPQARRSPHELPALSEREHEVLHLMARGLGNQDIAQTLRISPHTVRTHVQAVLGKLQRGSRASAVGAARQAGLLAR